MKRLTKNILEYIRNYFLRDIPNRYDFSLLARQCEVNSMLLARQLIHRIKQLTTVDSIHDVEFKVFSQWGEDGIIQYIINSINIINPVFIEFGVENYIESNTKFLLMNNNWRGFVIDSDEKNIRYIQNESLYWQYDLTARCAFVTKDNINNLILESGFHGDIGLLSIDIDGNDYWVWDAINVASPRIVICEYNSLFGPDAAITIPYSKDFNRTEAHYSNLYFGVSLKALCLLAEKKGYDFIGSNSAGSNAFFIRKDLSEKIKKLSVRDGYVATNVRESFDEKGRRNFLSGNMRLQEIAHLPVYDVLDHSTKALKNYI